MWRLEKDPYLSSNVGNVTILDRAPDFDRLRARMEQAIADGPAPALAGAAEPGRPRRPGVGRRSRLRHRLPRPPHRAAAARDAAPALRPRRADDARPVRPHAPAVAVHDRRRARGRAVGAVHEDAPHDHRRDQRRADVDGVPRLRPRRRAADVCVRRAPAGADSPTRRRPSPTGSPPWARCGPWSRAASGCRSAIAKEVRGLLADPANIPKASAAAVGTVRGLLSQLSDTEPLGLRCGRPARCTGASRPCARSSSRRRPRPSASAAAQHRVPHRRRRSGIALPRRARRTVARAAGIDGDQHPHRGFRRQRLHAGADARPDRRDADRRALRPRRPTSPTRLARHPAPARWRPWPRWRRRCRRR